MRDLLEHSRAIAIVGMAGRFPGARDIDEFRSNLENGIESIRFFTEEELLAAGVDPKLIADPNYVKAAPVLNGVDLFDAPFFDYSARDAEIIDPQHRIFLECAWEALENAGYGGMGGNRSIGVFGGAGCVMGSYLIPEPRINERLVASIASREHVGNDKDHLCTRVSHKLNLCGPSVTVQTACSTSLVAVHLACQSLLNGECGMALAGGVTVRVPQNAGYLFKAGEIFSPDGHCRTFDARAAGTLFGSGAGVVVLKPLRQAVSDGDHIHAVIRGSAINNDGSDKFSYWATSREGQTDAISKALKTADVPPETIGYVEAHGTATMLGDLMETLSLKKAFDTKLRRYCAIGSVKTNIGHLDAAAGIAGLIKAVLSLQHKRIFPSLHFHAANPRIDFDDSPFYVNSVLRDWDSAAHPRRAAVNSLGVGGTNAHVILEEAPDLPRAGPHVDRPVHLLTVSAKSSVARKALLERYRRHLSENPALSLADFCYTANTGRAHFGYRAALGISSVNDAIGRLAEALGEAGDAEPIPLARNSRLPIGFLFSGQGAQYVNMGRELYDTQPTFRQAWNHCDQILRPLLGTSLLPVVYSEFSWEEVKLNSTAFTQPALFALEYALAETWKSWGVHPQWVLGHSAGEYVAACVAGVFSLEDGLKLIAARGGLMQALAPGGQMVAVLAGEGEVRRALEDFVGRVTIAAINGPHNVVISGEFQAVNAVVQVLAGRSIQTRSLAVSHAFHSPLMEPMLAEFARVAGEVSYHEPRLKLVSNVTGELARAEVATADYWVRHVREAVRFADGVQTLREQGAVAFLEIGPGTTLMEMGRQCLGEESGLWLSSLRRGRSDWEHILGSLAELYVRGAVIDWAGFDRDYVRRKVALPTYPFQRQRHWLDAPRRNTAANLRPLVHRMFRSPLLKETLFETAFGVAVLPFLADHRVYDAVVSPGACQVSMVLSCADLAFGEQSHRLTDIIFPQPMIVPETGDLTVQLLLTPQEDDRTSRSVAFKLISFQAKDDTIKPSTHAIGVIESQKGPGTADKISLSALRARCPDEIDIAALYESFARRNIVLGLSFRWLESVWKGNGEALAKLRLPRSLGDVNGFVLHPGLLDAGFQVASIALQVDNDTTMLPFGAKELRLRRAAVGVEWWCHVRSDGGHKQDIRFFDPAGEVIAEADGFEMRAAGPFATAPTRSWQDWLHVVSWQARPAFGRASRHFPETADLSRRLESGGGRWYDTAELARHEEALAALEAVSLDFVVAAFARAGFTLGAGARWRTEQMARQFGVVSQHRRLFERLLGMLEEEGILSRQEDDTWRVVREPGTRHPGRRIQSLMEQYGQVAEAELTLLSRCGEKLSEVLRGAQHPLELLFPGGDTSTAAKLYRDSPRYRAMNTLVANAVTAAIGQLPPDRGVRILEVGAGTGGTTAALLGRLPARQTDYVFTDIGETFVAKAREQFRQFEFLRGKTLDIEREPCVQGFEPHQYDIVIAVNVLHATKDMGQTVANVRELLAPGGILVLSEATHRSRWVDLVFGLTDGWWQFSDERQGHPLLSLKQWHRLLGEGGFEATVVGPDELVGAAQQGQVVMVARSPKQVEPELEAQGRPWLIFADGGGVGPALVDLLQQRGERPILIYPADDYAGLVDSLPHVHAVVHLWSLNDNGITSAAELERACERACRSVLEIMQVFLRERRSAPRLWLVTCDAQVVGRGESGAGFAQGPLWGLGRVIALEHPEFRCSLIDLDASSSRQDQAAELCSELTGADWPREDQVAFRNGARLVARLAPYRESVEKRSSEPLRLEITERGGLDGLQLRPLERRMPGPGEVEIRVWATGLNFIDVLDVLGMLPFDRDNELGGECAGEIVAAGPGVTVRRIGEKVAAFAWGCLGSYVTVASELAVAIPDSLTFEQAATVPISFSTARYALHDIGGIAAGDRVLIHAAAGGLGMAAVQIARQSGAEVFATASPAKWKSLQSLGVEHIYDSRTLDFAGAIMGDTNGRGVNAVLNSLSGPGFIEKSLSVLGTGGRFLEAGKRDVWTSDQVCAVRPDVAFHLIDLRQMINRDPATAAGLLSALLPQFGDGRLAPLPRTTFSIYQAANAFRYMQQARHVGKIVIMHPVERQASIRPHATYLITGGLGALGLLMAEWLVQRGARHLLLVGRHGAGPDAQRRIDELQKAGAEVMAAQVDVTDIDRLAACLERIDRQAPLRGIIHGAGTLDDGTLVQQNWIRFSRVLGPKVLGAWNLHALTREMPLDFFVFFSSIAGLTGSRGQANHAAANAFLDTFAHYLQARRVPALSIDWGPWSGIGAAAEMVRRDRLEMDKQGRQSVSPAQGLEIFAHLLAGTAVQAGVLPVDWSKNFESAKEIPPFFSELIGPAAPAATPEPEQHVRFSQRLERTPPEERSDMLIQLLRSVTAKVLGTRTLDTLDQQRGFMELGLDSLMAIEFRNHLVNLLERQLPATLLFDYPTLSSLARYLAEDVFGAGSSNPNPASESPLQGLPREDSGNDLAALSDEEAGQLLAEKLEQIGS
ncbi:MAG TPA: SDR family NAD(P)-dependent oxidoreductase [Bryobacteraceae bacterium]|nr:SDR family NAD(P)-dependent oxidoreductase [Bryobacteraceae bacterium]